MTPPNPRGPHRPSKGVLAKSNIPTEVLAMGGHLNGLPKDSVGLRGLDAQVVMATVRSILRLRSTLRRLDPDLLHVNSLKSGLIGSIAGRLAGVPVVWHVHDRIAPDYLPAAGVKLIRTALRVLPDAVIANSEATRATLPGIKNVAVIGNAFSSEDERPQATISKRVDAPLQVVMVGRLAPWKGQKVFLEAFAQAFAGSDVEAVIAGSALFGEEAYLTDLKDLAQTLGIDDQVEFAGHVDDVPTLLMSADIVVHASTLPEPFGQVVVEAMAFGRAVIASNAGGPTEIITNGIDGILVHPSDSGALAAALQHLEASDKERLRIGAAAAHRAAAYRPEIIAPQVEAVYHQAVH